MTGQTADAVVIGAGPNGLVAANALVDAGWDVVVLEANDEVGGAVRSAEVTAPGFVNDLFSAFYPLAAASPVIRGLDLEHARAHLGAAPQTVLAHALDDGRAAVLFPEADAHRGERRRVRPRATARRGWRCSSSGSRIRDPLLDALFTPFPPISLDRAAAAQARQPPARSTSPGWPCCPYAASADEHFGGDGRRAAADRQRDARRRAARRRRQRRLRLAADHARPGRRLPGARGRRPALADALRGRLVAGGGEVRTRCRGSTRWSSRTAARWAYACSRRHDGRAPAAPCSPTSTAPPLYRDLVGLDRLPARMCARPRARSSGTTPPSRSTGRCDRPVPWRRRGAHGAGTVHLGQSTRTASSTSPPTCRWAGARSGPFVLFGQMTTADPTRSPAGTESAWAYTHVPLGGRRTGEAVDAHVERMRTRRAGRARLRRHGRGPHVQTPADLQSGRRQPRRGRDQRRHVRRSTSSCSSGPTPGLGRPGDPGARALPRERLGASRRRRPRRLRVERRPRGAGVLRTRRRGQERAGPDGLGPPAQGLAAVTGGLGARPPRRLPSPRRAPRPPRAASGDPTARARPRPSGCGSSTLPGCGATRSRDWPPSSSAA